MQRHFHIGHTDAEAFWGEIAPCEHMLQLYEDETVFLDVLEGFVAGGLKAGDSVIVIATPQHLGAIERRLRARGIDPAAAVASHGYIPRDAGETLATFMVDGWPDEKRFGETVHGLLDRARARGRRVRAFGEMVAVLWAQGAYGATVGLELLWHRLCEQESFSLLCAYPRSGFSDDAAASLKEICDAHASMIETTRAAPIA
jgi:hypothetical protein